MKTKNWDARNISDQAGRVAIVTGSSSGIGFETARVLASKNAIVVLAVRNMQKGTAASNKIRARHKSANVIVMELDLASLDSVKKFSASFVHDYSRLDLLINNAGVMIPPYSKTADGFELQFGTNHLGHFALTGLLLGLLQRTQYSRIVNVASSAHQMGNINFDDLAWEKRAYSPWRAYGDSKIANLYFTYQLQKKFAALHSSVIVASSHPGWTSSELQRYGGYFLRFLELFAQTIEMGALPSLYAATGSDVKNGDFFGPSNMMGMRGYPQKVESNTLSHDPVIAEKLWTVSEQLTGVPFQF